MFFGSTTARSIHQTRAYERGTFSLLTGELLEVLAVEGGRSRQRILFGWASLDEGRVDLLDTEEDGQEVGEGVVREEDVVDADSRHLRQALEDRERAFRVPEGLVRRARVLDELLRMLERILLELVESPSRGGACEVVDERDKTGDCGYANKSALPRENRGRTHAWSRSPSQSGSGYRRPNSSFAT